MLRTPIHLVFCACVALACQSEREPAAEREAARGDRQRDAGGDAGADRAQAPQRPAFCARPGDDAVRAVFCADDPPEILGLYDLRSALQLVRAPDSSIDERLTPESYQSAASYVAVMGHSTALAGRVVSPINPRVIVLGAGTVMAYQRGVQRIELAARALGRGTFNFYLLSFSQACNERARGCTPGDLYTPQVERDWTGIDVRDDEELKNTSSDCRQCHRRGRDDAVLLMRELEAPWTHFFAPLGETEQQPGVNGSELMRDYLGAKGAELYGGLALHTISPETAFRLQVAVGQSEQPLLFDAPAIEDERWPFGPDGYAAEPQPSPTWERGYEAFKRGEQLALPYLEARAVDPVKQERLITAYQRYLAGEIEADELPDLSDIFPDDPRLRARIGLETEPDATPVDALIQACGGCHNDVLDQSISRARFNIELSRLDRAEIAAAIDRIERPRDAPGAMPPPEARQLTAAVRERLVAYLQDEMRSPSADPRLARAARLGMVGGGQL